MGVLFINANGGGGISDDITAKKNDVLKGKTAVTADSDDEIVEGTLELTGNASAGNVEVGKTFYNTNAHSRQTGILRNATNDTSVKHTSNNTTKVIKGDAAYVSVNTDGVTRAEIRFNESRGVIEPNTLIGVPQNTMAKAGGLTEGKLLKGQSAFGLTGTATGDATSGAGDILSGKTAYVNGNKVTGTMANQGAKNTALNAGGSYTIPAGYHNGKGKVTANSLSNQTTANAVAADVLKDKTAWVNGSKITGTMNDRRVLDSSIGGINTSYPGVSIHKGANIQFNETTKSKERMFAISPPTGFYENGTSYVGAIAQTKIVNPSASQQNITADSNKVLEKVVVNATSNLSAGNIKQGVTVGGIAGTFTGDANATASQILSGKTAYVNGNKITGNIASMAGGTYTPRDSQQTISCSGKYMTSNIFINSMPIKNQVIEVDKTLARFNSSGTKTVDVIYETVNMKWLIFYTYVRSRNTNTATTPANSTIFFVFLNKYESTNNSVNFSIGDIKIVIPPIYNSEMIKAQITFTTSEFFVDNYNVCLYGYLSY